MPDNGREWLTEGEIRNIVLEESKEIHAEIRDAFLKQNMVLDKISDASMAQLNSIAILHGNPQMGLKGAIPDLQERVGGLEDRADKREGLQDSRHAENIRRFEAIEENQQKFRRMMGKWCRALVTTEDGKPDYKKPIAIATGAYAVLHYLFMWLNWANIKIYAAKVAALFR